MQIDRIDNNGPYSPENCRWATRREQCRNRSQNTVVSIGEESHSLIEWAEIYGTPYKLLMYRIKNGWPILQSLTTPQLPIGWTRKKYIEHGMPD
jgi:hypothetical protein